MSPTSSQFHSLISGQGPSIIWSHGLMQSLDFDSRIGWFEWQEITKCARLIRYDVRGHGKSPLLASPENNRWDRLAEDMLTLADETKSENFIAAGLSMGSATALYTALFAPERVRGLILVIPPTAWENRAPQALTYQKMADRLKRKGVETIAQLMALSPSMPEWMYSARPEKAELAVETVRGFSVDSLASVLLGAGLSNLPDTDRLAGLKMPALILAWSGDNGHPLVTAERLAANLPQAELVVANSLGDVESWTAKVCEFARRF